MNINANAYVDISRTIYPDNFVKAKAAILKIKPGELLKIRLKSGQSLLNVPKNLEEDGHKTVIVQDNRDGTYTVLIEKGM